MDPFNLPKHSRQFFAYLNELIKFTYYNIKTSYKEDTLIFNIILPFLLTKKLFCKK